jgi:sulfhydrogenase subunit delta
MSASRPRVGVFKLASCDGCQLTLLSCDDELLQLMSMLDLAPFPEATSRAWDGPLALALVEGSVSTEHQRQSLLAIRARAAKLVVIGACATAGGIQALRNYAEHDAWRASVYASPAYVSSLATSTPISAHVPVDYELRGCPIDRHQLLEVLTAFLIGRKPQLANESVCAECKRAGRVCVTVSRGEPCLGPLTHSGCGALCPRSARGCYGCFGPKENTNPAGLGAHLRAVGTSADEVRRRFQLIHTFDPGDVDG